MSEAHIVGKEKSKTGHDGPHWPHDVELTVLRGRGPDQIESSRSGL